MKEVEKHCSKSIEQIRKCMEKSMDRESPFIILVKNNKVKTIFPNVVAALFSQLFYCLIGRMCPGKSRLFFPMYLPTKQNYRWSFQPTISLHRIFCVGKRQKRRCLGYFDEINPTLNIHKYCFDKYCEFEPKFVTFVLPLLRQGSRCCNSPAQFVGIRARIALRNC